MANTLKFGKGTWATKTGSSMAYNDQNGNYKPLPFNVERDSIATRVNKQGLIEVVGKDKLRIDYTDSAKGVALLEPSRTNSLLQSNQFDTTWTISADLNLTSNQSGVFGSNDAWLLKKNVDGSRYIQQSLSLSSAQYSYSVYLKAESTNWAFLWSYDGSASVNAYFDLENGVVGQTGGADLDGTNIESVGNGWYRCTLIYTHAPDLIRIYPANSNGDTATGADNGIYIQHAQLEAGSYATSYIPTSGSTVQRQADVVNGSGNSEVFNDSEGVLFADIAALTDIATSERIVISDGISSSNRVVIEYDETFGLVKFWVTGSGTTNGEVQISGVNKTQINKISMLYETNVLKVYINGFNVGNGTGIVTPIGLDNLKFEQAIGGNNFYGKAKEIGYYDATLTDSELEYLTSYRSLNELVTELNLNTL